VSAERQAITARAAEWLIRLRSPDASAATRAEFTDWLRESPLHIQEYLAAVEVWEALSDSNVADATDAEMLVAAAKCGNVVPLEAGSFQPRRSEGAAPRPKARTVAAAAGVAAVALSVLGVKLFFDRPIRLHTDTGESRVVVLQDKSVMHLNTRSDVVVQLSRRERHIELLSGEAFFEVATDAQRPFVVRSGSVSARALGTKFAVTKRADVTLVTVAEGRVLVAEQSADPGSVPIGARAAEVGAGEQAMAAPRGISKARVDAQVVLAWRDGKLVFDGDSLGKVVDEFNRYNPTPIVIADPAVAERRVSGVFSVHDPESLMLFLERSGDVSIRREENGTVTIGARH